MIEVFIKSVSPFSEYDNVVYSYKVTCLLNSGKEIEVIDEKPFNLTFFLNKKITIKLGSHFIGQSNDCHNVLEGMIKQKEEDFYFFNDEILIFLSKETIDSSKVSINKKGKFCFEELFLKSL